MATAMAMVTTPDRGEVRSAMAAHLLLWSLVMGRPSFDLSDPLILASEIHQPSEDDLASDPSALSTTELVQSAMEATTQQDWDRAVQWYLEALEREPNNVGIYNNLGVVMRRQGDLDGAVMAYRRALELDPTLDTAVLNLIIALLSQRDWQAALETLEEVEDRFPTMATLKLYRGLAHEKLAQWPQALTAYQAYSRQQPDALGYYRLAITYWQLEEGSKAADAFRRAAQLDPNAGFYSSEAGRALAKLGVTEEAALFLERLPQEWPDPDDFIVLARLAHQLDQSERARRALDRALTTSDDPTSQDPAWLNDAGVVSADETEYVDATQYLLTAVAQYETTPDPDPKLGAIAYSNLADVYWSQKQLDLALAAAQKALELDSQSPQAHNTLAAILVSLELPAEAIVPLQTATDLDPTYWQAYRNLAIAYALLGDQDRAFQSLQAAIAQAPTLAIVDNLNQELVKLERIEPLQPSTPAPDLN